MNITTEQYNEEAKKNFEIINNELSDLSNHYIWLNLNHCKEYKDFWIHAKQISEMFKSLKPIKKEDRENLWDKFNSMCDEMKRKQTSEYDSHKIKSDDHKHTIISEIRSAQVNSIFGFDPPDIQEMKRLSGVLRNAGALLSRYKNEMTREHKQECFERIQETQKEHNAWWESLTNHRSRNRENYQEKLRSNIDKNRERLRKSTDALERCKNHVEELREKIRDAWNDEYIDMAEGWLSEEENRISDIEESIQRIEGWISEDEEKLR